MVSVGDEFEVDRQGDVPREYVAAARQLCLEVEAPVAAVDDGGEIERGAPAAVEIVDRGDERAGGGDRPVATPRIVSTPSSATAPSSMRSSRVEAKSMCGYRAASKKSAPSTMCARNSAGRLIVIDATRARPVTRGPSSVISSRAWTSSSWSRKVPTPMWRSWAWNDEWSGSAV